MYLIAFVSVLLSCTAEENNGSNGYGNPVDKTVHVTGISLNRTSATIKEGEFFTLIPTVTPDNADNKNVTWSSSSDAVATVDNSGKVIGVKAGSATITATTEDGGMKATCALSVEANLAPSVTIGAGHISAVSVVLSGEANLESSVSADMTMGIMWSTNSGVLPSNSQKIEAKEISAKQGFNASYSYNVDLKGLDPAKTYYFRSYITQNGQDTYGETMEFTTKELSSLLHTQEATAISAVSAKLNADMDMTDVQYKSKAFGFYWGPSAESVIGKVTATEGEGTTFADLSALAPSTQYFYQAFVVLDGKELKETVLSLSTKNLESLLETKEATDIEATSAKLNAKLDLTDVNYNSISYGFYWGTSEASQSTNLKGEEIADSSYSSSLKNLSHKTQYWYKSYLKLDSQTLYGEVKTFTTDVVPVESVSLDKTEYTFHTISNTLQLQATILPSDATDKSVEWTSSHEDVAIVDANGKVTAKGNGAATITAMTKDQGKTATCTITVAQYVTEITLSSTSLSLNEGQEQTLTATVNPDNANDKTLKWTSSNESVATVDQTGKVTAVSKGTATIKAEANDGSGKYGICSVTVNRLVSSIVLNKTSLTIYNGKTETLTATVTPSDANNTSVTWTSSNTSVATVSSSGVVRGLSRGNATIQVTANDGSGVKATCIVEVKQYVTGISIDKSSLSLLEKESYTLIPTISPANANDKSLTWVSSDASIASVDEQGKVTGVSKGSTTITATANDGSEKSRTCRVTVRRPVSSITLNKTSLVLFRGSIDVIEETLTATVIPSDADNPKITWTSSDPSIVNVYDGCLEGKARGTAIITATAQDGSGAEATCEVEVKQLVTGIQVEKNLVWLPAGESMKLDITLYPSDANDTTCSLTSSDESVATVDNNGVITAVSPGVTRIDIRTNDGSDFPNSAHALVYQFDTPEAVDLGLSVKWATFNLGASSPEDCGAFYAWGETAFKELYSDSTYEWFAPYRYIKKYCPIDKANYWAGTGTVDGKVELKDYDYADDVARKKLGGGWRIPTDAEWTELRTQCTWTWAVRSGVEGMRVKSNNGNSIFLPSTGSIDSYAGQGGYNMEETTGRYWSSSLSVENPLRAWYVYFTPDEILRWHFARESGLAIRPVTD